MKAAAAGALAGGLPQSALAMPRDLPALAAKQGECGGCQASDELTHLNKLFFKIISQ